MSAGLISRFGRCFLFATGKPHPSRQARLRGRRPLLCSAARGAVRHAKQKKTVPSKNSEAIFWRPRFTRPLRTGKRANANFACSEGFFCARCAAPSAGVGRFYMSCMSCCLAFAPGCPGVFLQAPHVRVWQRQLFARFSAGMPFSPACVQFAASLLWLPVCPARTIPLLPGRPPV